MDICKCTGENCPFRNNCFRFTAREDYWQSYASFSVDPETGICDDYWPIHEEETKTKKVKKNVRSGK